LIPPALGYSIATLLSADTPLVHPTFLRTCSHISPKAHQHLYNSSRPWRLVLTGETHRSYLDKYIGRIKHPLMAVALLPWSEGVILASTFGNIRHIRVEIIPFMLHAYRHEDRHYLDNVMQRLDNIRSTNRAADTDAISVAGETPKSGASFPQRVGSSPSVLYRTMPGVWASTRGQ